MTPKTTREGLENALEYLETGVEPPSGFPLATPEDAAQDAFTLHQILEDIGKIDCKMTPNPEPGSYKDGVRDGEQIMLNKILTIINRRGE